MSALSKKKTYLDKIDEHDFVEQRKTVFFRIHYVEIKR